MTNVTTAIQWNRVISHRYAWKPMSHFAPYRVRPALVCPSSLEDLKKKRFSKNKWPLKLVRQKG